MQRATESQRVPLVDIHAHAFPTSIGSFVGRSGGAHWPRLSVSDGQGVIERDGTTYRRVDVSYYEVEPRLEWLGREGFDLQVVSPLPVLLTYWADPVDAHEFARRQNQAIADFVSDGSGSLVGFGTVPLQDTDRAVATLDEIRSLGLAGVEIGTHVGDRELDHPSLQHFFAAAEDLDLPILVHPLEAEGLSRVDNPLVRLGIGVPMDTGLTAAALSLSGILVELPRLRVSFSHGGGTFLWSLPRLERVVRRQRGEEGLAQLVQAVRRLFVDTAGLDATNVAYLRQHLSSKQFLVGSDFPAGEGSSPLACLQELPASTQREIAANASRYLGRDLSSSGAPRASDVRSSRKPGSR